MTMPKTEPLIPSKAGDGAENEEKEETKTLNKSHTSLLPSEEHSIDNTNGDMIPFNSATRFQRHQFNE
jgi:hypothetical protein